MCGDCHSALLGRAAESNGLFLSESFPEVVSSVASRRDGRSVFRYSGVYPFLEGRMRLRPMFMRVR